MNDVNERKSTDAAQVFLLRAIQAGAGKPQRGALLQADGPSVRQYIDGLYSESFTLLQFCPMSGWSVWSERPMVQSRPAFAARCRSRRERSRRSLPMLLELPNHQPGADRLDRADRLNPLS